MILSIVRKHPLVDINVTGTKTLVFFRSLQEKEEEETLPEVATWEIIKKNASEWPYIVGGVLGSAIQGTTIPLYAILFGEILGVSDIFRETG